MMSVLASRFSVAVATFTGQHPILSLSDTGRPLLPFDTYFKWHNACKSAS